MLTSFVGHEQDITKALQLIRMPEVRLLSIVGPGGVGKTRFALQLVTYLTNDFTDGIVFVPLASVREPNLVISTIAQVLEVVEDEIQTLLTLKNFIGNKQLLLLLDNFEQVIAAAAQVAQLVAACPRLKILVTSREVLRVRSEHIFVLSPLALPNLKRLSDVPYLLACEAIQFFEKCVQAMKPSFILNETNVSVIAEICIRLDGLPLAIELAAARMRLLSPQELLVQLEQRLQVLTGGARDLPDRQRTLRATIQWSYELLPLEEQHLFRWLSVFVDSFTLQAIQSVCANDVMSVEHIVDSVMSLLDKSLLQQSSAHEKPRLAMLALIREYGMECLELSGEREMAQRAHAQYYIAFAQTAEPELSGTLQAFWLEQVEREQGNLRAAHAWLTAQQFFDESLAKVLAVQESRLAAATHSALDIEMPRTSSLNSTLVPTEELTVRELAILRLVAKGLTNVQIAAELVISTRTVNAHLRSIYKKLQTSSRVAITHYAINNLIT